MYYSFEACIGDANVTLTWAFTSGPVRTNNLQSVLFWYLNAFARTERVNLLYTEFMGAIWGVFLSVVYIGPHFFVQLWYIDAFRSIVKLNMPTNGITTFMSTYLISKVVFTIADVYNYCIYLCIFQPNKHWQINTFNYYSHTFPWFFPDCPENTSPTIKLSKILLSDPHSALVPSKMLLQISNLNNISTETNNTIFDVKV